MSIFLKNFPFLHLRWFFFDKPTKILVFIFWGLLGSDLVAQNLHFSHFSDAEGLSQNSVRKIFQDSKGYIWLATEDGLNRYSGTYNEIYKYKSNDSSTISSNIIFDIKEDHNNHIWISTTRGVDKWDAFSNRFIHYKLPQPESFGYRLIIDEKNQVWCYSSTGLFKIDLQQQKAMMVEGSDKQFKSGYSLEMNKLMLLTAQAELYIFDTETQKFSQLNAIEKNKIKGLYPQNNYLWWVREDNALILADLYFRQKRVFNIPFIVNNQHNITAVYEEEGVLFVGLDSYGLFTFDTLSHQEKFYQQSLDNNNSLSDNRITTIYKSPNSPILWVGTYGGGVNYCNLSQKYFHHYAPDIIDNQGLASPFILAFCEKNENEVWIGTDGKGLELWNRKTQKFTHLGNLGNPNMNILMSIYAIDTENLLLGASNGLFQWNIKTQKATAVPPPANAHALHHVSTIAKAPNGDIWVAGEDEDDEKNLANLADKDMNIWIYHPKTKTWDFLLTEKINSQTPTTKWPIYVFSDNKRMYILLDKRIYYQENERVQYLDLGKIVPNEDMGVIYPDNAENIWIHSKEQGIVSYNFLTHKTQTYQRALDNQRINAFLKDKEGNIWASHDHGLSKLTPKNGGLLFFDMRDGLQSNEFIRRSALRLKDGTLLFGGVNGFNHFNPKEIESNLTNYSPRINIDKVTALVKETPENETQNIEKELVYGLGEKNVPVITLQYELKWEGWKPTLSLNYGSLTFYYSALEYLHPKKCKYRYRLRGSNEYKSFEGAQQLQVRYPQELAPGNYTFEVQVSTEEGKWSNSAKIQLVIKSHWTQSNIFKGLLTLLFFALATFLIYQRIQRIREKDAEAARIQNEVTELKSKSLRAQMNPHFIFNALNSVQDFILDQNFRESARYLTKFSRLIRLILDHSETQFVILGKEIELISYYIDMEMLRFNDKFTYSITLDEKIEKDNLLIPSMIIQPYIENAIWHGLMHKQTDGELSIRFGLLPNNLIECVIIDNGIGREASMEMNKNRIKRHQSRGMDITKQQIELLKQQNKAEIGVQIVDLKNEGNVGIGTKVIIHFPFKLEN